MEIDLMNPDHAYIFGLLQADGNFYEQSRNRGKISLEISIRDEDIIYKLEKILTCKTTISKRTRNTNFKNNCSFIKISLYDWTTRDNFKELGLPAGKKAEIVKSPLSEYSEIDYWRGIVDGDGSMGITANGFPFLSLVTKSDELAASYQNFLRKYLKLEKNNNKNKRDRCYNICIWKEDAQKLSRLLYYNGCLAIDRKINSVKSVVEWKRPISMKKIPCGH